MFWLWLVLAVSASGFPFDFAIFLYFFFIFGLCVILTVQLTCAQDTRKSSFVEFCVGYHEFHRLFALHTFHSLNVCLLQHRFFCIIQMILLNSWN